MTHLKQEKLPLEILEFWWKAGPSRWFDTRSEFDNEIKDRFHGALAPASEGYYDHWIETPHETLALLILLDQFSRNIFRNSKKSFENDSKAVSIALNALDRKFYLAYPSEVRQFFFLPLEHSENIEHQTLSVDLFRQYTNESGYLYALIHMDVIRRFGRFPHRNEIMGRESTAEELLFLESGGFSR